MRVLGLSFGFHDSAAALIVDGQLVAACQEERFSRIKNDPAFPAQAINYCLSLAGLTAGDLDVIAYYEQPLVKFDRVVANWQRELPRSDTGFATTVARWLRDSRLDVRQSIAEKLGVEPTLIKYCRHHDSHAAAAYFCSPFDSATIVTLDGVGEYETASICVGKDNRITRISAVNLPHSIGLFYSAFTAFLGFRVNEGEYKVMGMAAFGRPIHYDKIMQCLELKEDGTFEIDTSLFLFGGSSEVPYSQAMIEMFGPPRKPDAPFGIDEASLPSDLNPSAKAETIAASQYYADIAASVQACTETVIRLRSVLAYRQRATGPPRNNLVPKLRHF